MCIYICPCPCIKNRDIHMCMYVHMHVRLILFDDEAPRGRSRPSSGPTKRSVALFSGSARPSSWKTNINRITYIT